MSGETKYKPNAINLNKVEGKIEQQFLWPFYVFMVSGMLEDLIFNFLCNINSDNALCAGYNIKSKVTENSIRLYIKTTTCDLLLKISFEKVASIIEVLR